MASHLFIDYRGPELPFGWLIKNDQGRIARRAESARHLELPAHDAAKRCTVLIPPLSTAFHRIELRAKSNAQLQRAIPYALEDQLAEPVEELHFALTEQLAEGSYLVAVINRRLFASWLEDMALRGIVPDAVVPASSLLPRHPRSLAVFANGPDFTIKTPEGAVFHATAATLPDWTRMLDGDMFDEIHCYGEQRGFPANGSAIVPHAEIKHWLDFAANADPDLSRHLLQGDFAPKHRFAGARAAWRWAGVAAGALLGMQALMAATEYYSLSARKAVLDREIAALYREIYPNGKILQTESMIARARAEQAALGKRAKPNAAFAMLDRIAPLLNQRGNILVKSLAYRNGALEILVLASGVQDLDALREGANALPGIKAELAAINATPQGTEGQLAFKATP